MQTANLVQPLAMVPDQPEDCYAPVDEHSALGLIELVLKNPSRIDALARDESRQPELIPRFLTIALAGFTIFGIAATVVLNTASGWPARVPAARWNDSSLVNLILSYDLGLIAAIGICLPSFYFYGLLAGIQTSMLQVTTHAMKGAAVSAITLVGILPIYVAVALGMIVFDFSPQWTQWSLYLALVLPFIAGLWGVRSLYVGFVGLSDTMAANRRCARECFLRRLILAWAGCYTAVTPLMIYTLWNHLSG